MQHSICNGFLPGMLVAQNRAISSCETSAVFREAVPIRMTAKTSVEKRNIFFMSAEIDFG
jgi:hypothetical protein